METPGIHSEVGKDTFPQLRIRKFSINTNRSSEIDHPFFNNFLKILSEIESWPVSICIGQKTGDFPQITKVLDSPFIGSIENAEALSSATPH